MSFRDAPPLRTRELVRLLDEHDVAYVLVGGMAAVAHGAVLVTRDLDLTPKWTDDNLEHLAAALHSADAHLRLESGEVIAVEVDAAYLRQFEVSTWRTDLGDIDVIIGTPTATPGRLADFDELRDRAIERHAFGVTLVVAHLDDIIESKTVLGRLESDLPALPQLHRLRDQLRADERGESGRA